MEGIVLEVVHNRWAMTIKDLSRRESYTRTVSYLRPARMSKP